METSVHAILLLASVPAAAWVSWKFAELPVGIRAWMLRAMLSLLTLAAVVWLSTGFFQCLCGKDNNPFLQGLIPGFGAAAVVGCVSRWGVRFAAVAGLYVLALGLSWHFHQVLFPKHGPGVIPAYTGATDEMSALCGKDGEARQLWHSYLTGLHACKPTR
jgi:hypothetical protein